MPTGISINGFNRKMDIMVIPSWDLFLGFSDARKVIEGRFTVISAPRPGVRRAFAVPPRSIKKLLRPL